MVVSAHKALGAITQQPAVWEITQGQGEALTTSTMAVLREYKIKPNSKTIALMNLTAVLSAVYAPKIALTVALNKQQRKATAPQPTANVTPIRTNINEANWSATGELQPDKIILN